MQQKRLGFTGFIGLILTLALIIAATIPVQHARAASPAPYTALTAMGMPTSPQAWEPSDFAVSKHLRNAPNFGPPYGGGTAMSADHGTDCSAPPAQHATNGNYADMAFVCHDHMMTALNSNENGYGELVFQPNQLVDFSNGATAHVSIAVSTNKPPNASRSWISFHFAPFNEQQSYLETIADGQNDAANDLQITNEFKLDLSFTASETVNGAGSDIPGSGANVDALVPPSAVTRTPFDFYISQTHLRVVVAGTDLFNANLPHPLNYTQAVFQTISHSYTPDKENLPPVTWHWSDLKIDRAVPYFLSMGMPMAINGAPGTVTFGQPAPAGARVRFQAFFDDVQVSFDNGATWQNVNNVTGGYVWGHALNVWLPVPTGAQSMRVRGGNGVGSGWYARDFYLMAQSGGVTPPPTPTIMPTATSVPPTPTVVPPTPTSIPSTPTPIPLNNTPCTVTLPAGTLTGHCSGTFTP
jgi:hypothetical protein